MIICACTVVKKMAIILLQLTPSLPLNVAELEIEKVHSSGTKGL